MQNVESWKPTKYELHAGRVRASRDVAEVSVASRLITDLVGEVYTRLIPQYCRGHLLDLGCGHAPFYLLYQHHADQITCMDWAESLHQNRFLDHVHDLTKPFPLEDNQFDTVICSDVMEHISEPAHVWGEIARVLKPGGTLILNVPFMYGVHEEPHDFHRYTEFALRQYAEKAGLTVEMLAPVGKIRQVLGDILAKVFNAYPAGKLMSRLVQYVANPNSQEVVRHALEGKGFNRRPLLYVIVAKKGVSQGSAVEA